jgi:hypothetical protein
MHVAFFGDGEHRFALTPDSIRELERLTGVGIGSLCRKVFKGDFAHVEIVETIRLSLIGAGTLPEEAAALVAAYAAPRPLNETYPVALGILEALWFGPQSARGTEGESTNG